MWVRVCTMRVSLCCGVLPFIIREPVRILGIKQCQQSFTFVMSKSENLREICMTLFGMAPKCKRLRALSCRGPASDEAETQIQRVVIMAISNSYKRPRETPGVRAKAIVRFATQHPQTITIPPKKTATNSALDFTRAFRAT